MANEILLNATLAYDDDVTADSLQVTDKQVTVASTVIARHTQSIATSDTVINLGPVATMGFVMLKNLDPTNYIEIKTAAAGTIIGKMFPGETWGPNRIGSGITAPAAIANSGACKMDVLITSA
jgi:hypothetical protein